jgi:hypothetical protein
MELGFEVQGRLDDGVNSVAVLTHTTPPTYAFLYAGTPFVELHSLFARGFSAITSDTPSRVDEFGEHEGRHDRRKSTSQHRFLDAASLLEAHRTLVRELTENRGPPHPTRGLQGAEQRLLSLAGRRSWRDVRALVTLALVFVGSLALAWAALAYFGE